MDRLYAYCDVSPTMVVNVFCFDTDGMRVSLSLMTRD